MASKSLLKSSLLFYHRSAEKGAIVQQTTSLLELIFDTTPPVEAVSFQSVDTALPPPPAPPKTSLNDVFASYLRMEARLGRVYSEQRHFEERLFGVSLTEEKSTEAITHIANRAIKALVRKAEREFAPEGGTLKIDEYEALKATNQYDWEERYRRSTWRKKDDVPKLELDLDAVWLHLENTYGGDAGVTAGLRQQAANLLSVFHFDQAETIRRTASSVNVDLRIWAEKKDYGQNKGMLEPSYHSGDTRLKAFSSLRCFAKWAELFDLANRLNPEFHDMANYGFCYSSREKRSFPGLEIVMYKERWEWRFSHEVAEKLMLFLGEYAIE
jgi:hypothetical protein